MKNNYYTITDKKIVNDVLNTFGRKGLPEDSGISVDYKITLFSNNRWELTILYVKVI